MTERPISLIAQTIKAKVLVEVRMTEEEAEQSIVRLLTRCGITEKANSLSDDDLKYVTSGAEALFLIDQLGRRIEERDGELEVGPHTGDVVEKTLTEIETKYHQKKNWLTQSVIKLVVLGGKHNSNTRDKLQKSILIRSFNYTHALEMASSEYREEGVEPTHYLDYDRPQAIGTLKAISDIILEPALRSMV